MFKKPKKGDLWVNVYYSNALVVITSIDCNYIHYKWIKCGLSNALDRYYFIERYQYSKKHNTKLWKTLNKSTEQYDI